MGVPLQKIKACILYFCEHTDPRFLGKVKLMKLIYFLDFLHVKRYGVPVTWDKYVNLEHGPIPSTIKNLVDAAGDDIDNSMLADTIEIERKENQDLHRIVPRRSFSKKDEGLLADSEMAILGEVCARFGDKNTAFVEKSSHEEAPWKKTRTLQAIPYSLAAEDKDCRFTKEQIDFATDLLGK